MDTDNSNTKFVAFDKYCDKCEFHDKDPAHDPCNDCLAVGGREGTDVPINYKEKE
ncbi:MAG: hypothetical protein LIR46_01585 [Bacteroidota bacterium]|nr:hypothetical protein [Bacteroidota bacterium]